MKKILYLASSVNGYIAKNDNSTEWSDEEWEEYKRRINEVKALIIGRTTYDIMLQDGVFDSLHATIAVITHRPIEEDFALPFTSLSEAIAYLENQGHEAVNIAGGKEINTMLLEKELVDEVVIDIEPFLYGSGIPFFHDSTISLRLELLNFTKLSNDSIQLHYKVVQ